MNDLKRLLKYVQPHWLAFLFAFVAMVFVAFFETATGALLIPIFDQFMPGQVNESKTLFDIHSLIPRDDWFRAWLVISGLLLFITIGKGIAEYFSSYLMATIGQSVVLICAANSIRICSANLPLSLKDTEPIISFRESSLAAPRSNRQSRTIFAMCFGNS